MKGFIYSLFLTFLALAKGASIPSGINACKISDEDCLKKEGTAAIKLLQTGDKNLGVNKFNPLTIKKILIPGNGGQVDLEQDFEDITFTGLGSSEVKKMKVDLTDGKCMIELETVCAEDAIIVGKYKLTGKLLLFTLKGSGTSTVTYKSLKLVHKIKCEKFKKDGDDYLKITDYNLDTLPKQVIYDFPNVISGDEKLSAEVNKVANENDLDIYNEIKDGYGKVFGEIFKTIMNQFFSKVPIKELFIM